MRELRIEIPEGQKRKTLMVITNRFNVGVRKVDKTIILNGDKSDIDDLRAILTAKIVDLPKASSEWIYQLADHEHPHSCSPNCKRPDTKAGCLGCPLA